MFLDWKLVIKVSRIFLRYFNMKTSWILRFWYLQTQNPISVIEKYYRYRHIICLGGQGVVCFIYKKKHLEWITQFS